MELPFSTSKWFLLFGYKTITNLVSLVTGNLLMAKSRSDVKESGKVARECVRLACYKTCVCKWVIFSSVAPTIIDKHLGACQNHKQKYTLWQHDSHVYWLTLHAQSYPARTNNNLLMTLSCHISEDCWRAVAMGTHGWRELFRRMTSSPISVIIVHRKRRILKYERNGLSVSQNLGQM